jgi:hypothetical protein
MEKWWPFWRCGECGATLIPADDPPQQEPTPSIRPALFGGTKSVTQLQFLAGDGAIFATFEPALSTDQAQELSDATRLPGSSDELKRLLETLAARWGLDLVIDHF